LVYVKDDEAIFTGTLVYNQEVTGNNIPSDPSKDGYTFNGWNPVVPERMPAHDVELVAQWSNNQYKITYVNTK